MAIPDSDAGGLARELLNAIGSEALDKTGGDIYRAGQPLLGDPDAPNAGSPPPPEPKPEPVAPKTEEAQAPPPPQDEWFLPGMYRTKEEAIKGIHETKRYANEALTAKQQVEQTVEQLRQTLTPPKPEPDPLSELEAYGIPKAPLENAIQTLAARTVQKMFEPQVKQIQADQQIVSMYPEYGTKFEEVAAFVGANKELSEKITRAERAGEYLLARELAWLNYERSQMGAKQQELEARSQTRVEKAKEQMADAAVTKPSQTTARTEMWNESPNAIPKEKFDQMVDLAKGGYSNQLWRATIGSVLARDYPGVFGDGQPG